jgi:hypothetical protein
MGVIHCKSNLLAMLLFGTFISIFPMTNHAQNQERRPVEARYCGPGLLPSSMPRAKIKWRGVKAWIKPDGDHYVTTLVKICNLTDAPLIFDRINISCSGRHSPNGFVAQTTYFVGAKPMTVYHYDRSWVLPEVPMQQTIPPHASLDFSRIDIRCGISQSSENVATIKVSLAMAYTTIGEGVPINTPPLESLLDKSDGLGFFMEIPLRKVTPSRTVRLRSLESLPAVNYREWITVVSL